MTKLSFDRLYLLSHKINIENQFEEKIASRVIFKVLSTPATLLKLILPLMNQYGVMMYISPQCNLAKWHRYEILSQLVQLRCRGLENRTTIWCSSLIWYESVSYTPMLTQFIDTMIKFVQEKHKAFCHLPKIRLMGFLIALHFFTPLFLVLMCLLSVLELFICWDLIEY